MVKHKKAQTPKAKLYRQEDFISIAEAVHLLADRDYRTHDTDRVRKARMRQHIMYAVNDHQLVETVRQSKRCYVFGRLVAWAQTKWPGRYDDLPALRDRIVARAELSHSGRYAVRASGFQAPMTLEACQSELLLARRQIVALEEQLETARLDAERLRPDAAAWQHQREVNRRNAQIARSKNR